MDARKQRMLCQQDIALGQILESQLFMNKPPLIMMLTITACADMFQTLCLTSPVATVVLLMLVDQINNPKNGDPL